ncbi:MAG: hypothetical protein QW379_03880 [Thermoplasmata archaeon]
MRAMPRWRRLVCLLTIALMVLPLPGAFPDWIPVEITPSATFSFPPGGGTCTTGLRVPVDGLVKGAVLNVTGLPLYTNHSWSANATEIWEDAAERTNLTLSPEGIGLVGFGSWWEETAEEALGRGECENLAMVNGALCLADKSGSGRLLSPALNVSAYSRVMVQGEFPSGTNYSVDILDPGAGNAMLQKGLRNGDELDLSLWAGMEEPYRELVMRLNVNTSDQNITPRITKWGVGTGWRENVMLYNTPLLSPFLQTYGNLYVNATLPPNSGYWVNVTDESNNTLLSYLKNGDPILVDASRYPKIRLNLTLWSSDTNVTPIMHEWGYGTLVKEKWDDTTKCGRARGGRVPLPFASEHRVFKLDQGTGDSPRQFIHG